MVKVQTFDEFSIENGVDNLWPTDCSMHMTSRHVSRAHKKASIKTLLQRGQEWQQQRDALRIEYNRLVEAGGIRPPTYIEALIKKACGHEDNLSVQAARRVLAKHGIVVDYKTGERLS